MNFMEAVKAMKEGKKVRLNIKDSSKTEIYHLNGHYIRNEDNDDWGVSNISRFEATDWEIVEDKKCKSCGQKLDDYETDCDLCLPCFGEDKKSLSDKVTKHCMHPNPVAVECGKGYCSKCKYYVDESKLKIEDVKQKLKEFIDWMKERNYKSECRYDKAIQKLKELMGERLIK